MAVLTQYRRLIFSKLYHIMLTVSITFQCPHVSTFWHSWYEVARLWKSTEQTIPASYIRSNGNELPWVWRVMYVGQSVLPHSFTITPISCIYSLLHWEDAFKLRNRHKTTFFVSFTVPRFRIFKMLLKFTIGHGLQPSWVFEILH
jgi:hypothetical protein